MENKINNSAGKEGFWDKVKAQWEENRQGALANAFLGVLGVAAGIVLIAFFFWLAVVLIVIGLSLILVFAVKTMIWDRRGESAPDETDGEGVKIITLKESEWHNINETDKKGE